MARSVTLGIKIQVQGQEKVIKNVQELEQEIEKLSAELKTLDFGSEEFKNASDNLGKLKAGLRDVDKQIEGVDREQTIQAFSAAVNGVTGAFLIASSAARTFGADAETVEGIAKAEQAALEGVNIALGVQALAELAVQRQKLIGLAVKARDFIATNLNTAAQTAYTVAVGASTGALRAFRIALAATGVGALVVGLGFLISKLFETTEETENLTKETKSLADIQSEASQSAGAEILKIEQLSKTLKDSEKSQEVRKELYKDLVKLVPELAGYTLEEAEATGILNQAINDQIDLIRLRARETALEEFLVQQEKERIAAELAEEQKRKQLQSIVDLNKVNQLATQIMNGMGAATFEQAQEMAKAQLIRTGEIEQVDDLNTLDKELLENREKQAEILARVTKRTQQKTKATEEDTEADKAAAKAIEQYAKNISDLISAFNKLNFEGEASADILDDANKLFQEQNDLLKERQSILGLQIGTNDSYTESLKRLVGGVIIPDDSIKGVEKLNDVFFKVLNNVIKSAEAIEKVNDGTSFIGDAASEELFFLVSGLSDVQQEYNSLNDSQKDLINNFLNSQKSAKDLIRDLNVGIKTYNDNLEKGKKPLDYANVRNLEIFGLIKETNKQLAERIQNGETEEQVERRIKTQISQQLFNQKDLTKLSEQQLAVVDSINGLVFKQAKFYGDVLKVNKELEKVTGEITDNINEQSEKLSDEEFGNLFTKLKNDAQSNLPAIKEFFSTLTTENSNLTQEQLDNINKLIEDVEFGNLLDKINAIGQAIIAVFSDISGRISSIVSQQNSLALEQLQYQEEQTLATIGDATEDAAAEQERARKKFAKQRFDLEKSSRITELQFSIADAIAQGASATLQALATVPFPASIGVGALYAGITAAQVATINSQLQFTKSKQFVGRRGGLLVGNSHENGGIMANGGLVLEGGEAIINRNAVSQFSDMLSQMSMSTGGRPLVGDDSRIVEEIRRQNQRPIKTYVLDRDIQNTRKINDRLSQLARL